MLGRYWKLFATCAVMWTSSVALGIGGTVLNDYRVLFWAGMGALVSCMSSAWFVAICAASRAVQDGKIEVETLATIMARVASEEDDVVRPIK